jgi:hypothetical protein
MFDDFTTYSSGGVWSTFDTSAGSGTVAAAGNAGQLTLSVVDTTANHEIYVYTTASLFNFTANKPIYGELLYKYTEANTNKASLLFGFMSSSVISAANPLVAAGTPAASFSGAVIFKQTGTLYYQTCSSIGTVQTTTTVDNTSADAPIPGGGVWQRLAVSIVPVSSTIAEVTYFISEVAAATADSLGITDSMLQTRDNTTRHNLYKDLCTYSGAAGMSLCFGIKNGSTSAESMIVDYAAAEYLR